MKLAATDAISRSEAHEFQVSERGDDQAGKRRPVATAAAATTCLGTIFYELVVADWVLPDGDGVDVADTAAQLGSKTLIVTGHLSDLPPGVADRHQLRSKEAGHEQILAAVRQAIGSPDEKHGSHRMAEAVPAKD